MTCWFQAVSIPRLRQAAKVAVAEILPEYNSTLEFTGLVDPGPWLVAEGVGTILEQVILLLGTGYCPADGARALHISHECVKLLAEFLMFNVHGLAQVEGSDESGLIKNLRHGS